MMSSVITQPVEAIRGSDKEKLLDLSVLDRAMSGPPASLRVKDKNTEQLRVGIIGGGLGGLITAMDLAEAGHQVEIFEARRFAGGKVGSWVDKDGNHIEMGELREEGGREGGKECGLMNLIQWHANYLLYSRCVLL